MIPEESKLRSLLLIAVFVGFLLALVWCGR